ncbi:MAG: 23S rRNA (adenine(2030)-N(6))-methyltransferase RlmJ [Micropepsaceae bacterium]
MNYRHAYHAGNFADVLKHAVLVWIVRYLQQKVAPLALFDTHAGAGLYDLTSTPAQKTLEAKDGILRLEGRADLPQALKPYMDLVQAANGGGTIAKYPGSASLMTALARNTDRVVACELHPADAAALRETIGETTKRRIIAGDGYRTLLSLVPPPEKRGLVLIDPPFEQTEEFEHLARNFIAAHRKFPSGIYLLWFPIKDAGEVSRLKDELANFAIKRLTLLTLDVARGEGLGACGLIVCNAPFTLENAWHPALEWLASTLSQGTGSSFQIGNLASE